MENPITGWFSWHIIGTYAGATAATLLILRVLQQSGIAWLERQSQILVAYVIAALLLLGADLFIPPQPDAASLVLCVVNAVGVALTAIGSEVALGLPVKPTSA